MKKNTCISFARRGRSLLASAVAVIPVPLAHGATLWDGFHLDVFGGLHGIASGNLKQGGQTSDASYDTGFLSGIALGRELSPEWSLELEWFYRSNDLDSLDGGPLGAATAGDFASTNLMLNVIHTFRRDEAGTGFLHKILPYVGIGFGAMQEVDIDLNLAGAEREFSDRWVPAAQIIGGLSSPITECVSVFGELRYHVTGSTTLEPAGGGAAVKADYNGFSILLGLRYSF
jgi:opacity protein-like surface antigen